ncbi:MAG: AbrB/MazE/SpoVT family DNA-binding domain-containing protein [Acidobacteriota bacterium]|jgi:AbrB family looped-hinge helix DNA binding protein
MTYQSRLSSKGQVTIPVEVRERLHLEAGDTVLYEIDDDRAVLRRAEPFDVAFHATLSDTLDEWASPEDEEAFRDL